MKDTINITISGQTGVGKSTLVYHIKEYLRTLDFDVEFKGGFDFADESEFDVFTKSRHIEKLQSICKDAQIVIHEQQENRKAIRK